MRRPACPVELVFAEDRAGELALVAIALLAQGGKYLHIPVNMYTGIIDIEFLRHTTVFNMET